MKVVVTGHNGYIGCVLTPMLLEAGHEVFGLDSYLHADCTFGEEVVDIPSVRMDIRDVQLENLVGYDAVIHLAGLSSDPLGDLDPVCTSLVNHQSTVRLALLAKQAGVRRFVFSSCGHVYGTTGSVHADEQAPFDPLSPYDESKVRAERELWHLADESFSPTFFRGGSLYGVSPRLRIDLAVNHLTALAFATGEIRLKSDGMSRRPFVHVEDVSKAFVAALEAPRAVVHNEAYNVGRTRDNLSVRELAELVRKRVPGSRITHERNAGPDRRSYCMDCTKIREELPAYAPSWTVREGIEQLLDAFEAAQIDSETLLGSQFIRVRHIRHLERTGHLDKQLRWSECHRPSERAPRQA